MAEYIPPTSILPSFDSVVFTQTEDTLTVGDANKLYKSKARTAYGSFCQTADIVLTLTTQVKPTFNTTFMALNTKLNATTSQISVAITGNYRITVSPNIQGGTGSPAVNFWLMVNNANIANSNSNMTAKSAESDLPFVEYFVPLKAGDYFEVAFYATGVSSTLKSIVATAPRPANPSIIVNVELLN